tara:strand:+ start:23 stop:715 length:693 start_codon:yes stop_codon:yes gene_type:complete
MKEYIKQSKDRYKIQNLKFYDKSVHILKPITNNVDIGRVLADIESKVPKYLTNNFEVVYVGDFDLFHEKGRSYNAAFKDGAIYITNKQDDYDDLIDDIVHEMAHSIERQSKYSDIIYDDGLVEKEFLGKRKYLFHILDEPVDMMLDYINPDYDKKFDMYLYKNIGYDILRGITHSLFFSPYAITALKEYWANGFENYVVGDYNDRKKLKEISPELFKKIEQILNLNNDEE